jgi:hypothetical protein
MSIKTCLGWSLMLLQHYEEHGEAFLSRFYRTLVLHYTPHSKAESVTWKWK